MNDYKAVAIRAAKEAGDILLQLAQSPLKYKMKSARDIQAEADLRAEAIIKSKIKTAFPDHKILAEESGEEGENSEYLWVIDPLDGTINYTRGIEEYAVSIALCKNGEPILGVIYQPTLDRLVVAEKDGGAYLNGTKLTMNGESELANCLAATDTTSNLKARSYNFELLRKVADAVRHVRIFGSTSLHLARTAQSQIDFYFKTNCNYWDVAAGILIVEESGGTVTDMEGRPFTRESATILVGAGGIHAEALRLVNGPRE
jgi:myo-inositol-1(or 4)-monophosphatase